MVHVISRVYAILLILAAIALGACVSQPAPPGTPAPVRPTPSPTKPPLPQGWSTRWLKGIPCQPPCWEEITPGQTTVEEAVEILRHSPFVTTVEVTTVPVKSVRVVPPGVH